MSAIFSWLQSNWLEATMLFASIAAVVATVVAVRVAVLALRVAKRSAQSADQAHERNVRLQARTALAEAHGSFQRLTSACEVCRAKWDQHRLRNGPVFGASASAPTKDMLELSSLRMQASKVLRIAVENLETIDDMALSDLEEAIPMVRQAALKIDALAHHIHEPGGAFH